jgi:hypothetical protein
MYNPKKKLPRLDEDVLVAVKTINGIELHEGEVDGHGEWWIHKYGKCTGEVVGWMYKPVVNDFTWRFLSFSMGFAVATAYTLAILLLLG